MQAGVPDTVYKLARWIDFSHQAKALKTSGARLDFTLAAPDENKQQKISLYSSKYFQACTVGGILACGIEFYALILCSSFNYCASLKTGWLMFRPSLRIVLHM